MAFLYVIADGEPDGLFWIEAGAKPENDLAKRLAKKPGSRFYLAKSWHVQGGPAGAEFLCTAARGAIPAGTAKRYKDGAWSGNLKLTLQSIDTLYALFKDGPADQLPAAEIVKGLRNHLGVQMVMLAQLMGVSTSMISRQEAGTADVSWQHIARVVGFCDAIGKPVPVALIFGKPPKRGQSSKGKSSHGKAEEKRELAEA